MTLETVHEIVECGFESNRTLPSLRTSNVRSLSSYHRFCV